MKNHLIVATIITFCTFFAGSGVHGAWYFDIVETSDNVYNFILVTDEDLVFHGGTGSFNYDDSGTLDWTYSFLYPSPLMELFGPPTEATPGDIDNLTGVAFDGFPTVSGDTVLATFTFTDAGDPNFRFDMDDTTMKFEINGVVYSALDYPEIYGGPGLSFALFSELETQYTNINTQSNPIGITVTPTESGRVNITALSSNNGLVSDGSILICTDEEGESLSNPLDVTAGAQVTLFLFINPEPDQSGTTTITVTVTDHGAPGEYVSTEFDLTVELADATLTHLDNITGNDPYYLSGTKGKNSSIWLQWYDAGNNPVGGPVEVVAADEKANWAYEIDLSEGVNRFSLETRAGSFSEIFLQPTEIILDTTPPANLPGLEITALHWPTLNGSIPSKTDHDIKFIVSKNSSDTESVDYRSRLDADQFTGIQYDFDAPYWKKFIAVEDPHTLAVTGADSLGNLDDKKAAAVLWTFTVDGDILYGVDIGKTTDGSGVRLEWISSQVSAFKLWTRQTTTGPWTESTAGISNNGSGTYGCTDSSSGGLIRCWRLTNASGDTVYFDLTLAYSSVPFPGDIDGEGDVNLSDVILSLKVVAGMEVSVELYPGADVNEDNRIGMAEVIFGLQTVAGLR